MIRINKLSMNYFNISIDMWALERGRCPEARELFYDAGMDIPCIHQCLHRGVPPCGAVLAHWGVRALLTPPTHSLWGPPCRGRAKHATRTYKQQNHRTSLVKTRETCVWNLSVRETALCVKCLTFFVKLYDFSVQRFLFSGTRNEGPNLP